MPLSSLPSGRASDDDFSVSCDDKQNINIIKDMTS